MRRGFGALFTLSILSIAGCAETPPPPAPPPPPPAAAPEPPPAPVALIDAPKASGRLVMISAGESRSVLAQPLDGSAAAAELVRRDEANNVAARCAPTGIKARKATDAAAPLDEVEAEPLKIGLIPNAITPDLANQLTEKTRLWQLTSPQFDFYKVLAEGHAEGLKPGVAAAACIRYSLFRAGALYSDMLFSVIHSPKKPEILTVTPVRIFYRDFPSLADQPGAAQAAVKVILDMRSFTIDRTSGRVASPMQNQEMLVELIGNPGPGKPVYQLYDPVNGPANHIPLPPWNFSSASIDPQHNLSTLGITVTEVADFDWLASQWRRLWYGWEYQVTDVAKLRHGADYYARTHMSDAGRP